MNGKMTVGYLIEMLQQQPKDAEVFISCQGYNNYDINNKTYREEDGTYLLKYDGKLFFADCCAITDYE